MKSTRTVTTKTGPLWRGGLLLACAVALGACTHHSKQPEPPRLAHEPVGVRLDGDGCPQSISNGNILIEYPKQRQVEWQAVDAASGKASEAAFCVYFDPFVGKSTSRCTQNGSLKSKSVDPDAPATAAGITYKYTIRTEVCKDKPLDPKITVRH